MKKCLCKAHRTARTAQIRVLSDCCADADEEVQRVLITKIFPRYAEVITTENGSRQGDFIADARKRDIDLQ